MLIGTDEHYYHNVNFNDLDTGRESRIFCEGPLYFFPKKQDSIELGNNMTAFNIFKGTKCIKVNENGLFVEVNDLNVRITTQFYDSAAVEKISENGLAATSIDYIEFYIERIGIQPDRVISQQKRMKLFQ